MEIKCAKCGTFLMLLYDGSEIYPCHTCIQKEAVRIFREFILGLPSSLLAAARTLENRDAKETS